MRFWLPGILIMATFAAMGGCARHGRQRSSASAHPTPMEALLPVTLARDLQVDDHRLGTAKEVDDVLDASSPPLAEHRALSAEQCQCLAIKASSEGNSLAAERRALAATSSRHGMSERDRLKNQVLWASELEARNRSAAVALTTYYHIAQAEANRPILERSLQELDDALSKVARMREQGLKISFDDGELKRQKLGLRDRQLELTGKLDQLNSQLVQLLGLSTDQPRPRIWPATDFIVDVALPDAGAAVAVGLATRPELRLLSSLRGSLNAKNVAITRGVVGGASTLIGFQQRFTGLLSISQFSEMIGQCIANHRELPTRGRQLAEYTDQRRRAVRTEIQQALLEAESALRRIAVEKETVVAWRSELNELAKKSKIDEATFLDISRAEINRLQAQSDEIEQIIAWKIALVKIKEGQGLLVTECVGNHCRFLDLPIVKDAPTISVPAREFVVPGDTLPEPENEPLDESGDVPLRPSDTASDSASIERSAFQYHVAVAEAIAKQPGAGSQSDTEIAPPDMAVEPPTVARTQ